MSSRKKIALFGFGRAGHIHFKNLLYNCRVELVYMVEVEVNKAQEALEQYGCRDTRVVHPDKADIVYNDETVDAVVVCTPTFAHEGIVRKALQHGKAVFCEKPIAEDNESVKACYEAADQADLPLMCSFNRRFDPTLRAIYNRVKSGEVGTLHTVKTTARDHPMPSMEYLKISGGFYHDCAVHDIDLVCWVLGEWPESVFAQAHCHNKDIANMKDVDTTCILMKFPSGTLATIDLSRNATYGYDQRIEVFGSDGMLVSENQRSNSVQSYNKSGAKVDPIKFSFPQRYAESYVNALEHFIDVIEGKAKLEISKTNTLMVSKIATACEESVETGAPVVFSGVISGET